MMICGGTLVRLTYENGIKDSKAKILKPKQVLFDKPMVVSFDKPKVKNQYYVYALGSLQGCMKSILCDPGSGEDKRCGHFFITGICMGVRKYAGYL